MDFGSRQPWDFSSWWRRIFLDKQNNCSDLNGDCYPPVNRLEEYAPSHRRTLILNLKNTGYLNECYKVMEKRLSRLKWRIHFLFQREPPQILLQPVKMSRKVQYNLLLRPCRTCFYREDCCLRSNTSSLSSAELILKQMPTADPKISLLVIQRL